MPSRRPASEAIDGALDAEGAGFGDVCVDHGGAEVGVAEEFLDGSNVGAGLEEVGGEGMPEGVASGLLGNAGAADGFADGSLEACFVEVVTMAGARLGVSIGAGRWEDPLPGPFLAGVLIFL